MENIEYCAFSDCSSLTSLTIQEGVKTIGNSAFHDCINLTSLTIPSSVTSIGDYAFTGFSVSNVSYVAHYSKLKSLTIKEGVTSIGNRAFQGTEITSLTIPGSAQLVGSYAFSDCKNLEYVTIKEGVLAIGNKIFRDCENLKSVTLPNSLVCIGEDAFSGDYNLTSIYSFADIPPVCTDYKEEQIGNGMFVKSKQHNTCDIEFPDTDEQETTNMGKLAPTDMSEPTATGSSFVLADAQVMSNCTLYVPMESEEDYRIYDSWREFKKIVGFDTTGIKDIEDITSMDAETRKQRIYSISGVRMSKPQPGLNIINGRKVIVK